MIRTTGFAIALVLIAGAAQAQLTDSQQREMAAGLRETLGLDQAVRDVLAGKLPERRVGLIFEVLKRTNEVEVHRMRGAKENRVYLGPDGKREAVYDRDGKLVRDGINDGTYNYFDARKDPLAHFTFDMAPWISLGLSPQDPTTTPERTHAYSADLHTGFERAIREVRKSDKVEQPDLKKPGAAEAIAILNLAIERGEATEILSAFEGEEAIDEESLIAMVKKVERGLNLVFQDERPARGADRP